MTQPVAVTIVFSPMTASGRKQIACYGFPRHTANPQPWQREPNPLANGKNRAFPFTEVSFANSEFYGVLAVAQSPTPAKVWRP